MFNKKETSKPDLEIFAIYDSKVGVYRDPIFSLNEWSIIRDYERLCRDERESKADLVTNAEDFQLFRIGTYSRRTAEIVPTTPIHIVNFHEVKTKVLLDAARQQPMFPNLDTRFATVNDMRDALEVQKRMEAKQ